MAVVTLAAFALLAAACGGDGESPEPTEIATLAPTANATDIAIRTPLAAQPATAIGRADCPPGWLAYETYVFSLCYPPDHYAEVVSTAAFPNIVVVRLIAGEPVAAWPFALSVWALEDVTDPEVAACNFDGEEPAPDEQRVEEVDIGSFAGTTCTATLSGQTQYYGVASSKHGSIAFRSQAATDEQLELAKQILATLRTVLK
jgi:hypothetical protein